MSVLCPFGDAPFEIEGFRQLSRDIDSCPTMPVLHVAIVDLLKVFEGCIKRVLASDA